MIIREDKTNRPLVTVQSLVPGDTFIRSHERVGDYDAIWLKTNNSTAQYIDIFDGCVGALAPTEKVLRVDCIIRILL